MIWIQNQQNDRRLLTYFILFLKLSCEVDYHGFVLCVVRDLLFDNLGCHGVRSGSWRGSSEVPEE